jgi:hypothetical protein
MHTDYTSRHVSEASATESTGRLPVSSLSSVLLAVAWIEPSGSSLAEPDETRYAEIPRR